MLTDRFVLSCLASAILALSSLQATANTTAESDHLEQVIVTAQKRVESLQVTPIAISVLGREQLEARGITSLDGLRAGAIPSLNVQTGSDPASTLIIASRGSQIIDMTQLTREPGVGVHLDGIYVNRPQGMNLSIPDLERIEVLRGPQGTLFGRNTTAGAVNLITAKPTGQFGFEQKLGVGNYGAFTSVTRINSPAVAGFSAKLDYMHSERDGWVKNSMPGQEDYGMSDLDGGRLSIRYEPVDNVTVDYAYDVGRAKFTSEYFQVWEDYGGLVGDEKDRVSNTRAPIPLAPSYVWQKAHTLIAAWDVSSRLTVKSLTGYRILDENNYESWGASLYYNGLINMEQDRERQFSQEFQFIGSLDQIDWLAGLYYFKSNDKQRVNMDFALDTAAGNVPYDPPISGAVPEMRLKSNTKSEAAYGQVMWTPEILEKRLHLTAGTRYTLDKKWGSRVQGIDVPYDLNSHHWDTAFTVAYSWTDDLSTYVKRSTGYRSGSVNTRSTTFTPFDPETVTSWEGGMKSEWLERRLRFNADVFSATYHDMQQDYVGPPPTSETLNSEKDVRVRGLEFDLTAMPVDGLVLGLSYTWMNANNPLQPNPLLGGVLQKFEITQAPRHAGALLADYTFHPMSIGTLTAHADMTSNSGFAHQQQDTLRQVGYTLFNARVALTDIPMAAGGLEIALWGKNLTDKQYPAFAFPAGYAYVQTFGDRRTFGVEATYRYQ